MPAVEMPELRHIKYIIADLYSQADKHASRLQNTVYLYNRLKN